jgi:hypothetical protein
VTAIKINLDETPPIISESAVTVLQAHGFVIARRVGESGALEQLPPVRAAEVFSELGRNAAQALVSIDQYADLDDIPPPEPALFCAPDPEAA